MVLVPIVRSARTNDWGQTVRPMDKGLPLSQCMATKVVTWIARTVIPGLLPLQTIPSRLLSARKRMDRGSRHLLLGRSRTSWRSACWPRGKHLQSTTRTRPSHLRTDLLLVDLRRHHLRHLHRRRLRPHQVLVGVSMGSAEVLVVLVVHRLLRRRHLRHRPATKHPSPPVATAPASPPKATSLLLPPLRTARRAHPCTGTTSTRGWRGRTCRLRRARR